MMGVRVFVVTSFFLFYPLAIPAFATMHHLPIELINDGLMCNISVGTPAKSQSIQLYSFSQQNANGARKTPSTEIGKQPAIEE